MEEIKRIFKRQKRNFEFCAYEFFKHFEGNLFFKQNKAFLLNQDFDFSMIYCNQNSSFVQLYVWQLSENAIKILFGKITINILNVSC